MNNIYEAIKILDSKEKRAALRVLFTKNPEIEARVERALPTCDDDEERVFYLESLLKPAQTQIEITEAFPEGLPYMKPLPLLNTTGSDWEYQPDISLKQTLKMEIKEHYKQVLLGKFDKTNIPIYFFLSGAGTGKSRNASEFRKTAISCFYENGTYLRPKEDDPLRAVGSRMLFQLLREEMSLNDVLFRYEAPFPMSVISLVAKHENRDMKDIMVILVVDGMQKLMNAVALSHRKRVYLPVASLKSPEYRQGKNLVPVFEKKDIMNILVEDCGGHGRALEVLSECMAGRSIVNCNIEDLMHDLRVRLTDRYKEAIWKSRSDAKTIARAILTRSLLYVDKPVPKTEKKPDQFVQCGLIRFERKNEAPSGYFTAPYIWFWIFAEISKEWEDPILRDWTFADYKEQQDILSSSRSKPWQSFENFVAFFRCLKSAVIEENEPTTISEVHAGARLNGDVKFINHKLHLQFTKHQTDTNSENNPASEWNVKCNDTIVDVQEFKHCIINAPSSPYGDAFLPLDQLDAKSLNEIHQYKHTQKSISQELYQTERKGSSSENDFFILFTTSEDCDIELPKRSGIVDGKVFSDYFGPFTGRAYRSVEPSFVPKVNINTASLNQLYKVYLIGKKRANLIISKRPFNSIIEANLKTKIPRKILQNLSFQKGRAFHMISRILP
ncbi:crinkler (CRN) family protein, putative [Rhizophagus clarus]|uniref:Crinkler (CRN) family protein, putative n=1 Tax=Rhizophagus clarus TaxID=94130 RepID=A0A8H3KVV3_9GLOM|nr:crinkler (CRN) family protein, putative [Rhizophagus clarus]